MSCSQQLLLKDSDIKMKFFLVHFKMEFFWSNVELQFINQKQKRFGTSVNILAWTNNHDIWTSLTQFGRSWKMSENWNSSLLQHGIFGMRETKGGWESKKAAAADQSKNGMLEPWLQSKGLSDAKSRQQLQLPVAVWATIQVASYIVLLCFHVFFSLKN